MTVEQALREISAVAARQRGLVTGAQLDRLGVDRAARAELDRRMDLNRLSWDVFEVYAHRTAPRYAYPYAAWLALRPDVFVWERPGADGEPTADAVLSHESATGPLGLHAPAAGVVTFTAAAPLPEPRAVRVLVARLRPDEVTVAHGLPVTTAHRTVLDLVAGHTDQLEVRRVIADAVRLDLVDLAALHHDLIPLADRHDFPAQGPGFAEWFLAEVGAGEDLSPRNAHALAALRRPGPVG